MREIVTHWLAFPLLKMSASDMNVHEEPVLCILYNAVEYARMCMYHMHRGFMLGCGKDCWLFNLTYQQESGQQQSCGHC